MTVAPRSDAGAAALADPVGSVPGLAVGGGDRDVAAEADDEVELQLFGQQPVELAVAEAAVGNEADLDPDGQRLGQADQRLVLVTVAAVLQGRRLDAQPEQRCGPTMAAEQREHQRGLAVGGELGPVHRHGDRRTLADHMADPVRQQGVDVDARVGQQAVDLLDGMLGLQAARQCQALADQRHRQRAAPHYPQRGARQGLHALGMQVLAEHASEELLHRRHGDLLAPHRAPIPQSGALSNQSMARKATRCLMTSEQNQHRLRPILSSNQTPTAWFVHCRPMSDRNEGSPEGYARISADDGRQTTLRQLDELRAAGCAEILEEQGSSAERASPSSTSGAGHGECAVDAVAGDRIPAISIVRKGRSGAPQSPKR